MHKSAIFREFYWSSPIGQNEWKIAQKCRERSKIKLVHQNESTHHTHILTRTRQIDRPSRSTNRDAHCNISKISANEERKQLCKRKIDLFEITTHRNVTLRKCTCLLLDSTCGMICISGHFQFQFSRPQICPANCEINWCNQVQVRPFWSFPCTATAHDTSTLRPKQIVVAFGWPTLRAH